MSMKTGPLLGLSRHMATNDPEKVKLSGKHSQAGERKGRKTPVNRERVRSEEIFNTPGENTAKTLNYQPAGWSYTVSGCKVDGLFKDTA